MSGRPLLVRVASIAVVLGIVVLVDQFLGVHSDAGFAVRISGFVVDPAGHPVAGAWVMTLPHPDPSRDDETWMQRLRENVGHSVGAYGAVRTTGNGSFTLRVEIPWGWTEGLTGWSFQRKTPPPYYALRRVVVEGDGFVRATVEPRNGEWIAEPADPDLFAELRLPPSTIARR